jgi:hypothetical protein
MDDLRNAIAMLFKRKGKNVLTEREFVFSASIDFRWYTPKEAQMFLALGLKKGLLSAEDGIVKPTFDFRAVNIPVNYRPGKEMLSEPLEAPPLFPRILGAISSATGMGRRDIVSRINRTQDRLGVEIEVAALVVARELGVEISELLEETRKEILER